MGPLWRACRDGGKGTYFVNISILQIPKYFSDTGEEVSSSDAREVINDRTGEKLLSNLIFFTQAVTQQAKCLESETLPRGCNKVNVSKG